MTLTPALSQMESILRAAFAAGWRRHAAGIAWVDDANNNERDIEQNFQDWYAVHVSVTPQVTTANQPATWIWTKAVLRCRSCGRHASLPELWLRTFNQGFCVCGGAMVVADVPTIESTALPMPRT